MRTVRFVVGLLVAAGLAGQPAAHAADEHGHGAAADPRSKDGFKHILHQAENLDPKAAAAVAEASAATKDPETVKAVLALARAQEYEVHAKGNILGFYADLGVWTAIVFLLLLGILWKTAWGPMLEGLSKREKLIASARDEAVQAKAEAQKLRDQLQAEMAKAHDQVRGLLEEARKDAEKVKEGIVATARGEAAAERDRMIRDIDAARDAALQAITTRSVELATAISTKALGRSISADDHRRLVDEALAEMQTVSNGTGGRA
jgi:F-type H+-transporting ATPase subunit b